MIKFIFSSLKNEFTGTFHLVYKDNIIHEVNYNDSNLDTIKRAWIKRYAPVEMDIEMLKQFVQATRTEMIQSSITYTFDDFWTKYNKKINKKRCQPLWNKLSPSKQARSIEALPKYDHFLQVNAWRTKADPENYLRNEMWDNDWK